MKVIRPITITSSKVLSSTAVEQYPSWSNATTYGLGDRVVYGDDVYESLISANTGKTPNTNKESWLDLGANNRMSMFDNQVNTQTIATESLIVTFQPGAPFNSLVFLNIVGNTIKVTVRDGVGGIVVYEKTLNLGNNSVAIIDWYTYFFEDFDFVTDAVFSDIPPYLNGVVEVEITGGVGNTVAIGSTCVGTELYLGDTQYGLNYGIRDYSIKETDDFGNTRFVERAFSKRMSPTLMVDNARLNYISKALQSLRATPTVYIAVDDPKFQGTIVYGFLKDWNVEISYPNHSMLSIEVDGLI